MWTVIFITCDKNAVDSLRQKFREAEILVRVHSVIDADAEDPCYEVMVPYAEAALAQDIIIEQELDV